MIKKLYSRFNHWMDFHPPGALSMRGWNQFNREFHDTAPIRYWMRNDFRDIFVYPTRRKIDSMKSWVRYRTTDRYHLMPTGREPGWCDASEQIMCVNFQRLVLLVEVYLAGRSYWFSDEYKKLSKWQKWKRRLPFTKPIVSRELGMAHLDWAATLDDPNLPIYDRSPAQAVAAREIRALYIWWKDVRNVFEPPSDISYHEQQQIRDDIDTEMLIRLIKIRRDLDD